MRPRPLHASEDDSADVAVEDELADTNMGNCPRTANAFSSFQAFADQNLLALAL